jgi:hypothetical protein
MTIATMLMLTLTGGLVLLKLALIAFAVVLLVKASMLASHPGSMNPEFAEIPMERRLQGNYKLRA